MRPNLCRAASRVRAWDMPYAAKKRRHKMAQLQEREKMCDKACPASEQGWRRDKSGSCEQGLLR